MAVLPFIGKTMTEPSTDRLRGNEKDPQSSGSPLAVLEKYQVEEIRHLASVPLSPDYWEKDASLQRSLADENRAIRESLQMTESRFMERFTL